jgi:hypothetical protein
VSLATIIEPGRVHVQIVARIGQRFGIDVSVSTMFDRPTMTGMAQYVRDPLLERTRESLVDPAHEA